MTARLVAVGHIKAGVVTVEHENDFDPNYDPDEPYIDFDLLRKQRIEDELAWGTDI